MSQKWLVIFASLLVILLFIRIIAYYNNRPKIPLDDPTVFRAAVLSEPKVKENYQIVSIFYQSHKVILFVPISQKISYGETIEVDGKIQERDSSSGKYLFMSFPQIRIIKSDASGISMFFRAFSPLREKIRLLFEETLPSNAAGLLLGIVVGSSEGISSDFDDAIKKTGTAHVVAASGMNVTLLAGFLAGFLTAFFRRRAALILVIVSIVFYAFLSGFEPPIIRASIMGSVAFVAAILGRQQLALYSLFLAGMVMLFFSPTLLFEVGFQLSFLATLGILLIKPILSRMPVISSMPLFGDDVLTTIAAQIGTLPIILGNFGAYSMLSILVNSLVLFVIPVLMMLGGLAALIGLFLPFIGKGLLFLCFPLLLYFEKTVFFFAGIDASVPIDSLPWQMSLGYYLILASLVAGLHVKRNQI